MGKEGASRMTLLETALAFARECKGLAHLPAYDITDHVAFEFTNPSSVMDVVVKCCADNEDVGVTAHFTRRRLWEVVVQRETSPARGAFS
jgi:hypothetical protein